MNKLDLILWFKDLRTKDIPLVGGKCANLGEVSGILGIPVPDGFAVTAHAYGVFLKKTGADKKVESLLSQMDESDMESLEETSKKLRAYIESLPMPPEIERIIIDSFEKLCESAGKKDIAVAVRSSATAEDLPWGKLRRTSGHVSEYYPKKFIEQHQEMLELSLHSQGHFIPERKRIFS